MIGDGASRRRLRGLIIKETRQIVRDPSSLVVAFVLPMLLLLLFGFGVSLDASRVQIGLVVEAPTPETDGFEQSLANSPFFAVQRAADRRTLEQRMVDGRLSGLVVLAGDFSQRLGRSELAPVQIVTDGSDPNTASLVSGYVQGAWRLWQQQRALAAGAQANAPIAVEPRFWFNPELDSHRFLVPGSIALIQMLIGSMLTALVIAREWERGTIEAVLATPTRMVEFIIGKVVPNFFLGLVAMVISVTAAVLLFHVPLRGSLPVLFGVTAVFQLAALGIGLLASTVARTQFVANQIAILVSFLPGLFFSGFVFELSGMPWILRAFSTIVPARYYVRSLQTLFLAGDVMAVVIPDVLTLAVMALVVIGLTALKSRTRLD